MIIKNRMAALILRILIAFTGVTGIVFYALEIRSIGIIKYFSVLTTIIAVLFYAYLSLKTAVELKYSGISGVTMLDVKARGFVLSGVLSSVIINFMVLYQNSTMITLTRDFDAATRLSTAGLLLNLVFPFLLFLDWLFFNKKFRFKWSNAFAWLLFPLAFFVVHMIRNSMLPGLDFVYYFLDYKTLGFAGVLAYVSVLSVILIACYLVFILADTALGSPVVLFSWSDDNTGSLVKK